MSQAAMVLMRGILVHNPAQPALMSSPEPNQNRQPMHGMKP